MSKLKRQITEILDSGVEDIIVALMIERIVNEYIDNNIGKGAK